jgi:RNA recognition motif-containing protein
MALNKQPEQQQRQIFIGNLAYETSEKELAVALEEIGIHVFRVRIVTDQDTGKSRGFGFVGIDRDDPKPISEILDLVNNAPVVLYGRRIKADEAHARPRPQNGQPRSKPRPKGGRGKAHSEFHRPRSEFDDDF